MNLMGLFKSPQNELEKGGHKGMDRENAGIQSACPKCDGVQYENDLWENQNVCAICGYHHRLSSRQRLDFATDSDSFVEMDKDMRSKDLLSFPGYDVKLRNAKLQSREKEGVLCGTASIHGEKCAIFAMDPNFMMGSMGTVVGEKITRLFEYATENSLPVVGYTVSGGARMQEGILSLMQMAKTSAAVKKHSDAGNFYLTVLTDPTTGGVTASFAMEGDVIMAEPGATIGFAGARVIEQTIRKKLPHGFQKAEFLMEHGFVDLVVPRTEHKETISKLLAIHKRRDS
jgi:acetyl-CoA carboxylase, carboxyl transferase, beta subunit